MTMLATNVILQLPKRAKVEVIPPWEWHPHVSIDGSKKITKPKEWFLDTGFMWKIVLDGVAFWVSKEQIDDLPETLEKIRKIKEEGERWQTKKCLK